MQSEITDRQLGAPVYANVYHFWEGFNKCGACLGLGVYHTGIQYNGVEYMYYGFDGDQSGVIAINPVTANYEFEGRVLLGYSDYTYHQFYNDILEPLEHDFTGNKYDLLANNCNHFAQSMSKRFNLEKEFPEKVFTLTKFCNMFRCCIPNCILNGRLDWFSTQQAQQGQYELQFQQNTDSNKNKK